MHVWRLPVDISTTGPAVDPQLDETMIGIGILFFCQPKGDPHAISRLINSPVPVRKCSRDRPLGCGLSLVLSERIQPRRRSPRQSLYRFCHASLAFDCSLVWCRDVQQRFTFGTETLTA